jgi:hypothetical protein
MPVAKIAITIAVLIAGIAAVAYVFAKRRGV